MQVSAQVQEGGVEALVAGGRQIQAHVADGGEHVSVICVKML